MNHKQKPWKIAVWQCQLFAQPIDYDDATKLKISALKHMAKESSNIEKEINMMHITKLCDLNKSTMQTK